eukprot:COSAG01_NODE_705_length_14144_cov_66.242862_19_plen_70_part_00
MGWEARIVARTGGEVEKIARVNLLPRQPPRPAGVGRARGRVHGNELLLEQAVRVVLRRHSAVSGARGGR